MFSIKIVTTKNEILLDNLSELEVCEIFANAYNSISNLDPIVKFTDEVKIDALTLEYFNVQ